MMRGVCFHSNFDPYRWLLGAKWEKHYMSGANDIPVYRGHWSLIVCLGPLVLAWARRLVG
jgi:hypothetical protein